MATVGVSLENIITKDRIPLAGALFEPEKKTNVAAIWLGGLTSRFYGSLDRTKILAQAFTREGIALAIFNHRGSGTVTEANKVIKNQKKHVILGTAFEVFEQCTDDIEAYVAWLRRRGYRKIILLGHSTGANKAAYYYYRTKGRGLVGIGLLGAVSDIPPFKKEFGARFAKALEWSRAAVKKGRSRELMPETLSRGAIWTAQRFLSLVAEGMNEDTFPYYDPSRAFYWTKNINIPFAVVMGERDEFAYRPMPEIVDVFKKNIPAHYLTTKIIARADHGFGDTEKQLASFLIGWMLPILTKK